MAMVLYNEQRSQGHGNDSMLSMMLRTSKSEQVHEQKSEASCVQLSLAMRLTVWGYLGGAGGAAAGAGSV